MGGQERAAVVVRGSFGKDHLSCQIRCNSSEAEALSWSRRPLHLAIQVAVSFSKKIKKIQVAVSSYPTGNWLHASMWWLAKALNSKEENLWTFGVAAKGSQGSRSKRLGSFFFRKKRLGRLRLFTAQDTKTGQLTIRLNMLMTRFQLLFVSDKPLLLYHRCWV